MCETTISHKNKSFEGQFGINNLCDCCVFSSSVMKCKHVISNKTEHRSASQSGGWVKKLFMVSPGVSDKNLT